jgi:hypothetical protein
MTTGCWISAGDVEARAQSAGLQQSGQSRPTSALRTSPQPTRAAAADLLAARLIHVREQARRAVALAAEQARAPTLVSLSRRTSSSSPGRRGVPTLLRRHQRWHDHDDTDEEGFRICRDPGVGRALGVLLLYRQSSHGTRTSGSGVEEPSRLPASTAPSWAAPLRLLGPRRWRGCFGPRAGARSVQLRAAETPADS